MKKYLVLMLAIIAFATMSYAADVKVEIQDDQTVDGYRLFYVEKDNSFNYSNPQWSGTEMSFTLSGFEIGKTYQFVARAFIGDRESPNSNIVEFTIPEETEIIIYPKAPKMLILKFE